jgi:UDP-N-acetylglucosamine:LPS N-acetylglucosamine transferase
VPTALFCTSPVGGGHALRDVAIGRELRKLLPDLEIIHVAGGPSAQMLRERGELVEAILRPNGCHAQDGRLDQEAFYFDFLVTDWVHAWQIGRLVRKYQPKLLYLDEIFSAVYLGKLMSLPTVLAGDMAGGPSHSLLNQPLASILNRVLTYMAGAAMLLVDRNLLIGSTDHVSEEHRRFAQESMIPVGPISQLSLTPLVHRETARKLLGYGPNEKIVTVSVGGSATAPDILETAAQAFPLLRRREQDLRMVIISGPGIDPGPLSIETTDGLELWGQVLDLVARFCASDAVLVQGGFTTLTECIAVGVPIVAVPLEGLWEQEANVLWAQEQAGAQIVRRAEMTPERIADAISQVLNCDEGPPRPLPPPEGGAKCAAHIIAEYRAERDPGFEPPH